MSADTDQLQRASMVISQLRRKLAELQPATPEPIAIIGMACRFPGAPDCQAFWRMVEAGEHADLTSDASRAADGNTAPKPAALLHDIAEFDPAFFDISPREALQMDPQQRLFLEVAWEALEDAGQTRTRLAGSDTGTFVGVHNHSSGYFDLLKAQASLNEFSGVGSGHDVIAGRLAYVLDLHGPTTAVNTACSSSLVAFHLACQNVLAGDCRMAIVGGVNLILGWGETIASLGGMLAADGRCKTFDARADGFGRGEGCGVVIIKRLSHALADRDRVLATVRASVVNQDGRTNGLTAPNGLAQQTLLRRALAKSGLGADDITYVEAHGTGTALGDPIEVEAIADVYGRVSESARPCALGSAKSNINHLEGAAGVAGIIKTVLALRARTIPPVAGFARMNPHVSLDDTRLFIPSVALPWESDGKPRIATVSSFGWSGVNAHVILQEADDVGSRTPAARPVRPVLALASTVDPRSLQRRISTLAQTLEALPDDALEGFAWTASHRRSQYEHRFAAVATDRSALIATLRAAEVRTLDRAAQPPLVVGLLFGDDRAALAAVAHELSVDEPVFADAAKTCADAFAAVSSADERTASFGIQVGLWALLRDWGVPISASAGFGIGAIVARYVMGDITLEAAVAEVCAAREAPGLTIEMAIARLRVEGVNAIVPIGARVPASAGVIEPPVGDASRYRARLWLLGVLASLYEAGAELRWDTVFAADAPLISLPPYPLRKRRFWITDHIEAAQPERLEITAAPDEWFFETVWQRAEFVNESSANAPFETWMFIGGRTGLAEAGARAIEARGGHAVLVRASDPLDAIFARAELQGRRLAVVDLRALDATGAKSAADAEALSNGVVDLERAAADQTSVKSTLFVVTRGAQGPLPFEPPASLAAAGVWGLCRSLRLERAAGWGGLIDLDPVESALDAERLVQAVQVLLHANEPELALRGADRYVLRLEAAALPARSDVQLKSDATYLVTGAFGVLGAPLAAWLADRGAKHLVLLGHAIPASTLLQRTLQARGVAVEMVVCELGTPAARTMLSAMFARDRPPLRGVFHLAGVTRATESITAADIPDAFRARVAGALDLDALTARMALDYFVCFSSAAAVLGDRNRAAYAAANACIDALVANRRARKLPGSSINWGLWGGRDAHDSDVRFHVRSGLAAMPIPSALDALGILLHDGGADRVNWHPLVAALDLPRLRTALETRGSAAILRAFDTPVHMSGEERADGAVEQLGALDTRTQQARLTEMISRAVRAVLEYADDDRLDTERGFFDLGMDSLMSVDLKVKLESTFGMSLPSTVTMDHPSVTALAVYFQQLLFGEAPVHHVAAVVAPADDEVFAGDLDDEGVAIALAAELRALELELQS